MSQSRLGEHSGQRANPGIFKHFQTKQSISTSKNLEFVRSQDFFELFLYHFSVESYPFFTLRFLSEIQTASIRCLFLMKLRYCYENVLIFQYKVRVTLKHYCICLCLFPFNKRLLSCLGYLIGAYGSMLQNSH